MKRNIALVGFMGTGKTVVGRALAKSLDMDFIELDSRIEKVANRSIPQIFKEEGEKGFRSLEAQVVRELKGIKDTVISCGGGVVLTKANRDTLGEVATVILLKADMDVIMERVAGDDTRPLLQVENRWERMRALMGDREKAYQQCADITVDTSCMSVDEVVEQIIDMVKEDETQGR